MEKTADILWKSCANGNNESFKSLFDTWYEPLCLRHLARQRGTQINRSHRSPKKNQSRLITDSDFLPSYYSVYHKMIIIL